MTRLNRSQIQLAAAVAAASVTSAALGYLLLSGGLANAAIVGTAHDFSAAGWNASGEVCVTCHTPHNSDTSVAGAPLWNHTVTQAVFTLYASDSLDAIVAQPDGASRLCLSCHDGTVALDAFSRANPVPGTFIQGSAMLSPDLNNDHPISFDYTPALAAQDGTLRDPTNFVTALGGTIQRDFMRGGTRMQCSACHEVHGNGIANFLRVSNAGSALCLTCHDK